MFSLASLLNYQGEAPNIVLVGVPHPNALNRALAKLKAAQIVHYAWHEPDYDFGFTAIAAAPDTEEQRKALANYRLWKHNGAGTEQSVCGFTPDRAANCPVAQLQSGGL